MQSCWSDCSRLNVVFCDWWSLYGYINKHKPHNFSYAWNGACGIQVRFLLDHVNSAIMTGQFSSDSVAVIERKLDAEIENRKANEDISSYYELPRCSEWIKQGRFNKVQAQNIVDALKYFAYQVALQFPDHLLPDSVSIVTALQQQNEQCKLYILGDTSYGRYDKRVGDILSWICVCSCCVDEVAADHVSADAIIHFGSACLTVWGVCSHFVHYNNS